MTSLKERVERRLREEVCHACVFRTAKGECSLEGVRECPILTRVDQIIDLVRGIDSPDITPYAQALREVVCANCEQQKPDGTCPVRDHLDCALDDYFAWIVNIVDEELSVTGRRP